MLTCVSAPEGGVSRSGFQVSGCRDMGVALSVVIAIGWQNRDGKMAGWGRFWEIDWDNCTQQVENRPVVRPARGAKGAFLRRVTQTIPWRWGRRGTADGGVEKQ